LDASSPSPLLELGTFVRIMWFTYDGSLGIFPGRVVMSARRARQVVQTTPVVLILRTRLALPGMRLRVVAWDGRRVATAIIVASDLPQIRSALHAAGFAIEHRTRWISTTPQRCWLPSETYTRRPGIAGKSIHVERMSRDQDQG
jgi:hypothetical protein